MTLEYEKLNKNAVEAHCLDYLFWMNESQLPRALMRGTKGMKEAGQTFLTKYPLETEEGYLKRLEESTLLNAYRKTCSFLAGQIFQSDVIFGETVDQELVDMTEDIDGKNNSIHVFAKRVFINGMGKGVSHILVDAQHVESDVNLTVEQEKEMGLRPFFREIKPEDIIGYRFDESGELEHIRIKETSVKPDGLYGQVTISRVRLFRNDGTWELHEQGESGTYSIVKEGKLSYGGIPLVSFIPGDEWSVIAGETPLMDLAELNLRHWRSNSDQINILHVGRVPILFGKHISTEKMPVGSSIMLNSNEDESDLKFVEISGSSITAGANDLTSLESKMALYGLQQLIPRSGNMTATEKAITSGESQSSLGTWAVEFETTLQSAFEIFEQFRGKIFPPEGITVNKEYNFGISNDSELTVLLKANEQGILSDQATFDEFRRRGITDEHLLWDDIKDQIEEDARNSAATTNLSGTLFGGNVPPVVPGNTAPTV